MTDTFQPGDHVTLLPCPFCDGEAQSVMPYGEFQRDAEGNRIDQGDFIECRRCGANIYRANCIDVPVEQRRKQLVTAWNARPGEAKASAEAPYFMDQADEALFAIQSSSVSRMLAADTSGSSKDEWSAENSNRNVAKTGTKNASGEATPREEGTMRSAKEWVEVARRFDTMFVPTKNPPLAYLIRDIQKDALRSRLPPGWVMVPEEPTEEMIIRGSIMSSVYLTYKAMLAAAKEGK